MSGFSADGHTFMDRATILWLVRDRDLSWMEMVTGGLVEREPEGRKTREGAPLWQVRGGLGRFLEDCQALSAALRLKNLDIGPESR